MDSEILQPEELSSPHPGASSTDFEGCTSCASPRPIRCLSKCRGMCLERGSFRCSSSPDNSQLDRSILGIAEAGTIRDQCMDLSSLLFMISSIGSKRVNQSVSFYAQEASQKSASGTGTVLSMGVFFQHSSDIQGTSDLTVAQTGEPEGRFPDRNRKD